MSGLIISPGRFGGGGGGYAANGVLFDGTNDYLSHSGDLTGSANSKLWAGSFWFKRGAIDALMQVYDTTGLTQISFASDNKLHIMGDSGGVKLDINTVAITDTSAWHHCMFSVDMADTGKRHLYIDNVSDLNVVTYLDNTIDFTGSDHHIGNRAGTTNEKYNGCLADVWVANGQYINLSDAGNRAKFILGGNPVDLGSDGSTPTSVAPLMFFSGATVGWHNNLGTGGVFVENGALTDCGTDP